MSTIDALIDPALRTDPHGTRGAGGVKRKGRGAPAAGASSSATDDTTPRTRVTRRQAAAEATATASDPPRTSPRRAAPDVREPSRGEEENRYEWASSSRDNTSTKRSRHISPSPHRSAVATPDDQWAPKGPASHPGSVNGAIGGMDDLAAAAAAAVQSPPASITAAAIAATGITRPPYPYGLTPFRYPCLTPHLPPPPPGDPANPAFHAFDPNDQTTRGSVASSVSSPPSVSTRPSSSGAGAPYQSLSTLLAASDSLSRHHSASAPGSRPMSSSGRQASGSGAARR